MIQNTAKSPSHRLKAEEDVRKRAPSTAGQPNLYSGRETRCPYPDCANGLHSGGGADTCVCDWRNPLTKCPKCSTYNVANARFCRACQHGLARTSGRPQNDGPINTSPAEFTFVQGAFYVAPSAAEEFLWCISADGVIFRLSPRANAKACPWATLPSRLAGFNSLTIIETVEAPPPFRGPLLLAVDANAVYGVSLATGEVAPLSSAAGKGEIVANDSVEQSICFRGVAASQKMFCFLSRVRGAPTTTLSIRYFHPERAAEEPVTIHGTSFLSPVIHKDRVGVCSDEEVWLYSIADQSRMSYALPRDFTPFFSRPSSINVPPNNTPFAIAGSDHGWEAWIAGTQGRSPGILHVRFDREYSEFSKLSEAVCINDADDGGLCINRIETIDFLGVERPPGRFGGLKARMPVAFKQPFLAYFSEGDPDRNRLTLFAGGTPLDLSFQDPLFCEDSCCAIHLSSSGVTVSYFSLPGPSSARGLKFVHWRPPT